MIIFLSIFNEKQWESKSRSFFSQKPKPEILSLTSNRESAAFPGRDGSSTCVKCMSLVGYFLYDNVNSARLDQQISAKLTQCWPNLLKRTETCFKFLDSLKQTPTKWQRADKPTMTQMLAISEAPPTIFIEIHRQFLLSGSIGPVRYFFKTNSK